MPDPQNSIKRERLVLYVRVTFEYRWNACIHAHLSLESWIYASQIKRSGLSTQTYTRVEKGPAPANCPNKRMFLILEKIHNVRELVTNRTVTITPRVLIMC